MVEFAIVSARTREVLFRQKPAPIPDPYPELDALTVEFAIVSASICEFASLVPIPDPNAELEALTVEFTTVSPLTCEVPVPLV
jgi:hypothetical protein